MTKDHLWWQKGIIYQIYPRSYQDSNKDGIGDLPGIRQRLDHLQSLNIDAVWLSPIYPSPMHDFGYDVADYTDIHPLFGTMADFDALLADVHARGLQLRLLILQFLRTNTLGSRKAAAAGAIPSAIGTSGAILPQTAARPTIGSAFLVAPPGPSTKPRGNITCISLSPSNQSSTIAIPTCCPPC